jgi:hypothetical protein
MLLFPEREIVSIAKKLHAFVETHSSCNEYRAHSFRQASRLAQLTDE